jgi:hypothetical protein
MTQEDAQLSAIFACAWGRRPTNSSQHFLSVELQTARARGGPFAETCAKSLLRMRLASPAESRQPSRDVHLGWV